MRIEQERVQLFMERIGDIINVSPTIIPEAESERRSRFIREEAEEYADANRTGNLVEVADAIADMLYVVIGAAVSHGIDIQPIFDEVHRSNMTKDAEQQEIGKTVGGVTQPEKRCVKGPRYQKPRIAELLIIQSTGIDGLPA